MLAIHQVELYVIPLVDGYRGAFRGFVSRAGVRVLVHHDDGITARTFASEAGARHDAERRSALWSDQAASQVWRTG